MCFHFLAFFVFFFCTPFITHHSFGSVLSSRFFFPVRPFTWDECSKVPFFTLHLAFFILDRPGKLWSGLPSGMLYHYQPLRCWSTSCSKKDVMRPEPPFRRRETANLSPKLVFRRAPPGHGRECPAWWSSQSFLCFGPFCICSLLCFFCFIFVLFNVCVSLFCFCCFLFLLTCDVFTRKVALSDSSTASPHPRRCSAQLLGMQESLRLAKNGSVSVLSVILALREALLSALHIEGRHPKA